jgi:para-nitrobenzyl esterase
MNRDWKQCLYGCAERAIFNCGVSASSILRDTGGNVMKLRISVAAVTVLLSLSSATSVFAQQDPPETQAGAAQLALANLAASSPASLRVTSPAFTSGGDIPFENTAYRASTFPGLAWTAGPSDTKSYAVIMQDGDALARGAPILHWTMINIPEAVTHLDPGMTSPPMGAQNGPNIRGPAHVYMGPHTPPGPKHRYHFQVFALDTSVPASSASTYAALVTAMKGHVLASGELIGLGQAPAAAAPK